MSWAKRRKTVYGTVVSIIVVGIIIVPAFLFFYKAPSCTDGIQNGKEQGIDCGGSCKKLCPSAFLSPNVAWTRFEELAPKLYNIATYIINPNTDAEAKDVPYRMALYDSRGLVITDFTGTVTLPPHRNTIAYKGAINVGERIPTKVLFEFTGAPNWISKKDTLASISILEKNYTEEANSSSLLVKLRNNSVKDISNVAVYAVLYDNSGNALGFSKTYIDNIPAQGTEIAPFTWPTNRGGSVISIEVLPVAE
jgi:hypothetical protein